ncbi:hypothetical protein [Flavobacterium hauense]
MNQKKLKRRIRKCEQQIDNLKTLPYYTVFKLYGQQQKDIAKVERKLHSLQSQLAACLPLRTSRLATFCHSERNAV